jgi:undecaprenol kinase
MNARKFLRSFSFAAQGVRTACKEQNMRFHLLAAIIVIAVGMWTGLTKVEWAIIIITIGIMLSLEMINTAIERVVDLASPTIHPLAKQAKDVAAGAVLVFAIASVIIGLLVFLPKWI